MVENLSDLLEPLVLSLRLEHFCIFASLDIKLDVCAAFINDDPMAEDVNGDDDDDDELCFVLVKLRPIPDDDV